MPFTQRDYLHNLLADNLPNGADTTQHIIAKARTLQGLTAAEVAHLLQVSETEQLAALFAAAREVKDRIYGKRIVLFAPLYYSNHCVNNCLYCGFRRDHTFVRKKLSLAEVRQETGALLRQGHKRLLVIGGEVANDAGKTFLFDVITTIYACQYGPHRIRRVNVEAAPMSVDDFRQLARTGLGTYVLFQETYDQETYAQVHPSGPKADYAWRLTTMDRALQAGLKDVGLGALFGLYDHRAEVLALVLHAAYLEKTYGVGPHTVSVPRIEPAAGAPLAAHPPAPVSDDDFKKIVAILRLALPYTGIILSTREPATLRTQLLHLGISQMSAASCTQPGGYNVALSAAPGPTPEATSSQFAVGDARSLDTVIADIVTHGYIPSFCTGCYRKGRTGKDFMDLAKPGLIQLHCLPNALLTFYEYLLDHASHTTRQLGLALVAQQLATNVPARRRPALEAALAQMNAGKRDIFF